MEEVETGNECIFMSRHCSIPSNHHYPGAWWGLLAAYSLAELLWIEITMEGLAFH